VLFILLTVPNLGFSQLADKTGLKQDLEIITDGRSFEVELVANFEVIEHQFSAEDKSITILLASGLENNLAEIVIPVNLINGNFTFFLDDLEIFPKVKTSEEISFITIEFAGAGDHTLEIIGTTYLPEFPVAYLVLVISLVSVLFLAKKSKFGYSFIKD